VRRWLEQTFAAFAIPQYRVLWIGTLTSFLAFFMSTVVNSVVAFGLTGTNRAVGSVIFAQGLSMFLFGPVGGAFADRLPKRRVIATGQIVTATVFVVAALLVWTEMVRVWHLAAGTFVLGLCFSFMGPARQAFVVDLVPPERRGNAMALSQVANNASRVGGPAIAGVLLAWKAAGATGAYATMAGLYALSASSLLWLPRSFGRADIQTRVLADVAAGLRYVRDDPHLRVLVLLFVSVVMTGFPYVAVMPGLVENELGRPADAISLLFGVAAAGGLTASVLVARYADSARARGIYSGLGLCFGLTLFGLASVPTYAAAVGACFALGAASGGFQTLSSAVVIHATEPEYMGRVMSLTMLAFAGFGLMGLPIGALADALGERAALVAMGVVVCVIVGMSWAALVRVAPRARPPGSREASDAA
jgi:MFS family permease